LFQKNWHHLQRIVESNLSFNLRKGNLMDGEKIIIQMEHATKDRLFKESHMEMEDLSWRMEIFTRDKFASAEPMETGTLKLNLDPTKVHLKTT
jgi:hypothetical protein